MGMAGNQVEKNMENELEAGFMQCGVIIMQGL